MANKTPYKRSTTRRSSLAGRTAETYTMDYSYIKYDLRRIGLLSGIFFGGMVILYFILPLISPLYAH